MLHELPIRALHRLDAASSRLRHSIVEACFYNLRVLAQELPGRRGNGDFAKNLAEALANVSDARRLIDAHFAYPVTQDLTIARIFPRERDTVCSALGRIETLAEAGAPSRDDRPACQDFADRMVDSVDELMASIAKVESTVSRLRMSARALLDELLTLQRPTCEAAGVGLELRDESDADLRVLVEREAALSALGELVQNAVRHAFADRAPADRRITIRLEADPETRDAVISVCDNGCGIARQRLLLLGEAGASTSGGGDGIAMVRRIIEGQHLGVVAFESHADKGTCVRVRLPRRAEPSVPERAEAACPPPAVAAPMAVPTGPSALRVIAALLVLLGMTALGLFLAWGVIKLRSPQQVRVAPDGTGDYWQIGDAVASAEPGATIRVAPGDYTGGIVLDRPVRIVGSTDGQVTLRASDGPAVTSTAAGASIENVRIAVGEESQSAAVLVLSGELRLAGCEVSSESLSCVEVAGGRAFVTGCTIGEGARSGVFVHGPGAGILQDNTIRDCAGSGIVVSEGADPDVYGNRIERCRGGGISVADAGLGRFVDNEVSHCPGRAVIVGKGADPVFRLCRLHDNPDDGIVVAEGGKGTFERNEIWGNRGHGVVLRNGATAVVRWNIIRGNAGQPIFLHEGMAALVEANTVDTNAEPLPPGVDL